LTIHWEWGTSGFDAWPPPIPDIHNIPETYFPTAMTCSSSYRPSLTILVWQHRSRLT